MKQHRLGIIGYGGFGVFLHAGWAALPGVRVAAVADSDASRDPGGVRFYTRWQELVADPDVDVVAIATPPAAHADQAVAALEAGKHVLIEKPLATTLADARRIADAAQRTGRIATVDYMQRFNSVVEALHAWSRSGAFGRLQRVVVENYAQDESLGPGHWFWDPAVSGGILVEHAVHFIDIVHGCGAGRPVQVDGLALRRDDGREDRVMLTAAYDSGVVASHFHAFNRPNFFEQTTQRFVFDLAQVEVEGWIPLAGTVDALVDAAGAEALALLPGWREAERTPIAQIAGAPPCGPDGVCRLASGGRPYAVTARVRGTFDVARPKGDVYTGMVQALMADLLAAADDPAHRLRVTLEDGISSLALALEGSQKAHAR